MPTTTGACAWNAGTVGRASSARPTERRESAANSGATWQRCCSAALRSRPVTGCANERRGPLITSAKRRRSDGEPARRTGGRHECPVSLPSVPKNGTNGTGQPRARDREIGTCPVPFPVPTSPPALSRSVSPSRSGERQVRQVRRALNMARCEHMAQNGGPVAPPGCPGRPDPLRRSDGEATARRRRSRGFLESQGIGRRRTGPEGFVDDVHSLDGITHPWRRANVQEGLGITGPAFAPPGPSWRGGEASTAAGRHGECGSLWRGSPRGGEATAKPRQICPAEEVDSASRPGPMVTG
jgi:hypothetical protein